jgi:hypothetical protein
MRVNVYVNHEWAIPKTAEVTGIPAEEILAKFKEAKLFGKACVFNVELTDAQIQAATDFEVGGDFNGA